MLKDPEKMWNIHYKGNVHNVRAVLPIAALGDLVPAYPELNNMCNFHFAVDQYDNVFVQELTEESKQLKREEMSKVIDMKTRQAMKQVEIPAGQPKDYYLYYKTTEEQHMLALHVDMVLDEAIRVKRELDLRALIEDALASGNKNAFIEYTTELKEVVECPGVSILKPL